MTVIQYDADNWLLSATRSLGSYVDSKINGVGLAVTDIEMSFPDTRTWKKETPLDKSLVHFEQDHVDSPAWGFGTPGKEVVTESPDEGVTPAYWRIDEAQQHLLNFDVGVWTSPESGGVTERMRLVQVLTNLFTVAGAKQEMYEATGGLWVVSFTGGRNELDRINDMPFYRATDMTLVIRVFSRHQGTDQVIADNFMQDEELSISNSSGNQVPVT